MLRTGSFEKLLQRFGEGVKVVNPVVGKFSFCKVVLEDFLVSFICDHTFVSLKIYPAPSLAS